MRLSESRSNKTSGSWSLVECLAITRSVDHYWVAIVASSVVVVVIIIRCNY